VRVRGDSLVPRPEENLYDLNRVLLPSAAGDISQELLAKRFTDAQIGRPDGAPRKWIIAQDLWAAGVITLRFLCIRTGHLSLTQWHQQSHSSAQSARAFVNTTLNAVNKLCEPVDAWRPLFNMCALICFPIANLSPDSLKAGRQLGSNKAGVLALEAPYHKTLRDRVKELSDAITAHPKHSIVAGYTSNPKLLADRLDSAVKLARAKGGPVFRYEDNQREFIDGVSHAAARRLSVMLLPAEFLQAANHVVWRTSAERKVVAVSLSGLPTLQSKRIASIVIMPRTRALRATKLMQQLYTLAESPKEVGQPSAEAFEAVPHAVVPIDVPTSVGFEGPVMAICTFGNSISVADMLLRNDGQPTSVAFAWRLMTQIAKRIEHVETKHRVALRCIGVQSIELCGDVDRLAEGQWADSQGVIARIAHTIFAISTIDLSDHTRQEFRNYADTEALPAADCLPPSTADDDGYLSDWRALATVFLAMAFGADRMAAARTFEWMEARHDAKDGRPTKEADRAELIELLLGSRPPAARISRTLSAERGASADKHYGRKLGSPTDCGLVADAEIDHLLSSTGRRQATEYAKDCVDFVSKHSEDNTGVCEQELARRWGKLAHACYHFAEMLGDGNALIEKCAPNVPKELVQASKNRVMPARQYEALVEFFEEKYSNTNCPEGLEMLRPLAASLNALHRTAHALADIRVRRSASATAAETKKVRLTTIAVLEHTLHNMCALSHLRRQQGTGAPRTAFTMACRKFTASGDDRRSALVRHRYSALDAETAQLAPEKSSLPTLEQAAQQHAIRVAEAHLSLRFPPLEVAPQHHGIVFEALVKACTPVLASNAEFANAVHGRHNTDDVDILRVVRAICAPHVSSTLHVCRAIVASPAQAPCRTNCPPENPLTTHASSDHGKPRRDGNSTGGSSSCFVDEILAAVPNPTPAGPAKKQRGVRSDDVFK